MAMCAVEELEDENVAAALAAKTAAKKAVKKARKAAAAGCAEPEAQEEDAELAAFTAHKSTKKAKTSAVAVATQPEAEDGDLKAVARAAKLAEKANKAAASTAAAEPEFDEEDLRFAKKTEVAGAAAVEGPRGGKWKPPKSYSSDKYRNVRFTEAENAIIMEKIQAFIEEHPGISEEELKGASKRLCWSSIIGEVGSERRYVAVYKRARQMLWGQKNWTKEETQLLKDTVMKNGPNWKLCSEKFHISPKQAARKWHSLLVAGAYQKKGVWSEEEKWWLRLGILEVTNKLVPAQNIRWKEVRRYVQHRTEYQCRQIWYDKYLPELLSYVDSHGYSIEKNVFWRRMVRRMRELEFGSLEEVAWGTVNKYWPAQMNKEEFLKIRMAYLFQSSKWFPSMESQYPFEEQVINLCKLLQVDEHRQQDKQLMKRAKTAEDFAALANDGDEA